MGRDSAVCEECEESFAGYPGGADQSGNHIHADFSVARNNQRAGRAWLFQFYMAASLARPPVAELFKRMFTPEAE
jgi:hypothetical protein